MPFCIKCGSSIKPGQTFCPSCGAPLPAEGPSASQPDRFSPVSPESPPIRQPARPMTGILTSHGKILGIIVIILIIAAGTFFVLSGSILSAKAPDSAGAVNSSGILPVNDQCTNGLTLCRGTCVDFQTDADNCGGCGYAVPVGNTCRNGEFASLSTTATTPPLPSPTASSTTVIPTPAPTSGPCPFGQNLCSGKCADLRADNDNCGKCGWDCPKGQICHSGSCLPPELVPVSTAASGLTGTQNASCSQHEISCNGSCVNIFTDEKNCGVCGRTCGNQEACVNARCGPACTKSGTTLCGDTCIDLKTAMDNCGTCGTVCPSNPPNSLGGLCSQGKCFISQCKPDYGDCNKVVSDGCETDIRFDDNNCGSCGVKCSDGQKCSLSRCV